jgi:hypothetical protein
MPAGQFFQNLTVNRSGVVKAGGPLDHATDQVVEMCVWVYQRSASGDDAIANAMDDGPGLKAKPMASGKMPATKARKAGGLQIGKMATTHQPTWSLDLDDRMNKKGKFTAGSATALAIGVFVDDEGKERVFLWSEPVTLEGPGAPPASP